MADSVPISDKWKITDTAPGVTNFNLLDISAHPKKDGNEPSNHKIQGPTLDAPAPKTNVTDAPSSADTQAELKLNKSLTIDPHFDPNAWQSKPLDQIYNHGMIDILSNPEKKERFGLRISSDPDDRNRLSPYRGYKLRDRSTMSLEYQIKF